MIRKLKLMVFCLFMVCSCASQAWLRAGHMISAEIAYQNLTPRAKAAVDRLMPYMHVEDTSANKYDYNKTHPDYTFMAISHWPDDIKSMGSAFEAFSEWHYISLSYSKDGTPVPKYLNPENVVWATAQMEGELSDPSANEYDRARALSFLVHFVGDAHQPLHAATMYDAQFPNGDQGGNLYKISYVTPKGAPITELHLLWDSALTLYTSRGYSYNPVKPVNDVKLADAFMAEYPKSYFGKAADDVTPMDWANEGLQIVKNGLYNVPEGGTPSRAYLAKYSIIAEQRITLAGYRLANVLNHLYANLPEAGSTH